MEIKGTHKFAASPQAVWAALHNPTVLKACIPALEEINWEGESAINVRAQVHVGPMSREFMGTLPVTEHTAPSHLKIEVHRNLVDGDCVIDLAPDGAGTTLSYHANVNVSGPVAPLAALARPMADGYMNQIFTRLEQQLG